MFPKLDPENNEEHRCLCGSKKVKPIMFMRDQEGRFIREMTTYQGDLFRIYCKPCYEKEIWNLETTEDW